MRDVIYNLPPLDSKNEFLSKSNIELHNVPIINEKIYHWISNTPKEKSAIYNQCCVCVNKNSNVGDVFCSNCKSLLPRPNIVKNGIHRLIKCFPTAYKRMFWDSPANTLTTNISVPSSDNKIHPEQHRCLSLYECLIIHTIIDYKYKWELLDGKKAHNKLINEIIGESIPPKGLDIIIKHLINNL